MISELWRAPVPIAHRGSRYLWPENTMLAFEGAVGMGYSHVETDLRMTRDGVLVCLHDSTVDRTTDGRGPVAGMSFAEVSGLDAGFRHAGAEGFPFRRRGIGVPRFEDLVTGFPSLRVVVDLKADGMAKALGGLIDLHGLHDRVIVGSYHDRRIDELRRVTGGGVATSTGSALTRMWLVASRLGRAAAGNASALQVPTQIRGMRVVDERLVRAAHRWGLQVHAWTVNHPSEMTRLLDMGVDGLVTDRPDLLRQVLIKRAEWPA